MLERRAWKSQQLEQEDPSSHSLIPGAQTLFGDQGAPAPQPLYAPAPVQPQPAYPPAPAASQPAFGTAQSMPQPGYAPAASPPHAAPGGFGAVELNVDAGKARKSKRLKSGRIKARPQGTFFERNIRKMIVGIGLFAVALVGLKVARDTVGDMPSRPRSKPTTSTNVAPMVSAASVSMIDGLLKDGNDLFRQKKYLEAVEKYAEVQKIDPRNPTANKMGNHACEFLVLNALGKEISLRSTNESERKAAYERAMADAQAALAGKGVTMATALEQLRLVQDFFPQDKAINEMVSRLESTQRARVVTAAKRKAEEHQSSISDLYAAAEAEMNRGDRLAAISAYQRVLEADPEKQTDYYWKSEEQIRQAKDWLSSQAKESYRSGLEAMKSQDYLTARSELRRAVRQDPYNAAAKRKLEEVQQKLDEAAQKFWQEAEIYEASNQLDMAIARYRKVVEYCSSPNSSLAVKAQKRIDALMR